jgi:hypothetical protein
MIPARLKDEELIKEVESFDNDEKHFHFWWLGQSGYLLTWKGNRVLLDPYLSDSLTAKYASTDKPHLRMSERVVDPNLLTNISAVTSSHNHTDHLDAETLIPIIKTNPEISMIIPEANRNFVCDRLHCSIDFPTGLDDGLSTTIGPFKFTGIPASHNEIEKDEEGRCKFLGYILQFGEWSIYHSGDTLLYEGMWLCYQSMETIQQDVWQGIWILRKLQTWERRSEHMLSFHAIMICLNSTQPIRKNLPAMPKA